MGLFKGSFTYTKFYVEGELSTEGIFDHLASRVRARAFRALTAEDDDTASVGWVSAERPLDDEVVFRHDGLFFGSHFALGFRVDAWKFPATIVKAKVTQAEREYRQKTGRSKITKAERAEIRDLVIRKLRRAGTPTIKVVDMHWNLDKGEVRFFGKSRVLLEYFIELFEKTFQVKLVMASAYTIGRVLSVDEQKLEAVEPLPIHIAVLEGVAS